MFDRDLVVHEVDEDAFVIEAFGAEHAIGAAQRIRNDGQHLALRLQVPDQKRIRRSQRAPARSR